MTVCQHALHGHLLACTSAALRTRSAADAVHACVAGALFEFSLLGAQVSALVRRYAGDDAKVPARRVAPVGSKRLQAGSAVFKAGAAAGATSAPQPQAVQPQPQRMTETPRPQAQPVQAATAGSSTPAALAQQPLGSSGKQPLQTSSRIQNGGSSSNSNHKTLGDPAKTGGSSSKGDGGVSGTTSKTTGAGSGKPPPPVSGAEVRARAAGIEAFKAFQQRQQELRRRRRTAAGDRQCCNHRLTARCPSCLHRHGTVRSCLQ
jgi:hypothetical protein